MVFTEMKLKGAFIIDLERHEDERGFFARTFCVDAFQSRGLNARLIQCSVSFNKRRGTLRGMHWQAPPQVECKLVRVTRGAIHDVIIDLRAGSPTFKEHVAVELTQENGRQERFHRTLKQKTARPPRATLSAQQRAFDLFRRQYNQERPHEALGQRPPASAFALSPRRSPRPMLRFQIDAPWHQAARIDRNGFIPWDGTPLFISTRWLTKTWNSVTSQHWSNGTWSSDRSPLPGFDRAQRSVSLLVKAEWLI